MVATGDENWVAYAAVATPPEQVAGDTMNILRLSILLLFTTMLIPIDASAHCKGKHGEGHEHCDPGDSTDPGDPITHVVTLTGAFAFETENNSVDVTANKQGKVLKGESSVTLSRPYDPADPDNPVDPDLLSLRQMIWDGVFDECPNFFGPTTSQVPGFTAPAGKKGWTIAKAGGVRVNFEITFPQDTFPQDTFPQEGFDEFLNPESAWVALSLIGDRDFDQPFPPPETIQLTHFTIHGQTESGVTPRLACDDENFALEDFDMGPPIFLTITAK